MKRTFSILLTLLAVVMVVSGFSATAFAAEETVHACNSAGGEYCVVCDVAAKINALPAAEEITVENAAAVTDQIHAIDRIKAYLDEETYDELLTLVESGSDSGGYSQVPVRYTRAVEAIRALDGTSLTVMKTWTAADGSPVDVSGAAVQFEITNVATNASTLVTLSSMPYVADSLSATAGFYSANPEGDGWSYKYILPAGTYTVREVSASGATVNGGAFITTSTTYTVDGTESEGSATVTVGDGGDVSVYLRNTYSPDVTVNFVKQNGELLQGPKMTFTAQGEDNLDPITIESGDYAKITDEYTWKLEITDIPEGYAYPFTLPYFKPGPGFVDEYGQQAALTM